MSKAYKCDRCGEYYDMTGEHGTDDIFWHRPNGNLVQYEICPLCAVDLENFFGGDAFDWLEEVDDA